MFINLRPTIFCCLWKQGQRWKCFIGGFMKEPILQTMSSWFGWLKRWQHNAMGININWAKAIAYTFFIKSSTFKHKFIDAFKQRGKDKIE